MIFEDARRVQALRDYRVLDTPPEAVFDTITQLVSTLFRAPIALVSLVDENRQWFKSRVGISLEETPRNVAFCDHAIRGDRTLVVNDAASDPRFQNNPFVTGPPHVRFYCGVPLRTPEGEALGTLCMLDMVPRTLSPDEMTSLEALARQVSLELDLRKRILGMEDKLSTQDRAHRSKELLASMLVHDLRNPLTIIASLAAVVSPADLISLQWLEQIVHESDRMRKLLTDMLDICLHSLGQLVVRRVSFPVANHLRGSVDRMAPIARTRHQRVALEAPDMPLLINVDPGLFDRILENLIDNALHHGPPHETVTVAITGTAGGGVRVEVRDRGKVIPEALRSQIFRAFEHEASIAHRGTGLGLTFCELAVEAHGGTIGVCPNESLPGRGASGNCFWFELPA